MKFKKLTAIIITAAIVFSLSAGVTAFSTADALTALKAAVGQTTLTDEQKERFDLNGDGMINTADALMILQAAVGIPETASATGNNINQDVITSEIDFENFAAEVLRLTNIERVNNGLSAFSGNNTLLSSAAMTRAKEIITNFSHTRPGGRDFYTAYTEDLGGVFTVGMGENIAAGQETPSSVVESWMNSEGHKKNILNSNYTHLGVGVAVGGDGQYYWIQLFLG